MTLVKLLAFTLLFLVISKDVFAFNNSLKRNIYIPTSKLISRNHYLVQTFATFHRNEKSSLNSAEVVNLGLTIQNLEFGINFINFENTVVSGSIRYLFYERKGNYPDVVIGFEDLFSEDENFTRTGFFLNKNRNSFFFMAEKDYEILGTSFDFSAGIGTNGFESEGGISQFTFGLFGGVKKQVGQWVYSFEFDGIKNYLSVKRQIGDSFVGFASLRGLEDIAGEGTKDGNNTLGFTIGLNFSSPIGLTLDRSSRSSIDKFKDELASQSTKLQEAKEYQATQLESQENDLDSLIQVTVSLSQKSDSLKAELHKLEQSLSLSVLSLALEKLLDAENSFYQQKYKAAQKKCEEAIALVPNLSVAHGQLGSILFKLGYKQKAIESFEKSLELDPNNVEIREFLSRIK